MHLKVFIRSWFACVPRFACLRLLAAISALCSLSWAAVPNRYIVELSTEPVARHVARRTGLAGRRLHAMLQGSEARVHRGRIRAEQGRARLEIARQSGAVTGSVNTVANALMVSIADENAAQLAQIPGVIAVHRVRTFKLYLDRAAVVHKVRDAWAQVGVDKAGAGIKIAIIDTGVDSGHAGFQDASLALPAGFPKTNADSDVAFTNNKVIVARSYANYFEKPDADSSARDRIGHGTATAMTAAGVLNAGPLATISGMAPKAYIGSYKVFGSPNVNDGATDDAILKAIDDAVNDGMDIISLSLGADAASATDSDPEVKALEHAAAVGVIVVVAAGNNGPDPNTIGSPATAPSAIAVGASTSDRIFAASATVAGNRYLAIPGSGVDTTHPVTAPLRDVSALDGDGLACSRLPSQSLNGTIAFILRGTCPLLTKARNAAQAGAVGAIIYSGPGQSLTGFSAPLLPTSLINNQAGVEIKNLLASDSGLTATLDFAFGPVAVDPNNLASFTSKGPNVDSAIKPDLVAVGTNVYTAAQKFDADGDLYDPSGYGTYNGTSFSTPIVAGAAALLKSARPGLTVAQYRSLLINSAAPAFLRPDTAARVQESGAGLLDMTAALRATSVSYPTSLSFGNGAPDAQFSRTLTISNIGASSETYSLSVTSRDGVAAPQLATDTVRLEPGASFALPVNFSASSLQPGQYEGFIRIFAINSGSETHVPYWYAVPSGTPRFLTSLFVDDTSPRAGLLDTEAIVFRITDDTGVPVTNVDPQGSVVSGGGTVRRVYSIDSRVPGAFAVDVIPRRGSNVFQIQAGDLTRTFTIVTR